MDIEGDGGKDRIQGEKWQVGECGSILLWFTAEITGRNSWSWSWYTVEMTPWGLNVRRNTVNERFQKSFARDSQDSSGGSGKCAMGVDLLHEKEIWFLFPKQAQRTLIHHGDKDGMSGGTTSIFEKPVVAVLCRPTLTVENIAKELGCLWSIGW